MEKEKKHKINVGIGFVTGRKNVCEVINHYYQEIINQVEKAREEIKVTVFILYDTNYQKTKREDFYQIKPEIFEQLKIQYITPEEIEFEKEKIEETYHFTKEEANLFLGNGHAKGRNTVMYFAKKQNMDYLLFWDDDEYPVACIKQEKEIIWKKQDNIIKHIDTMKKEGADVTIGYHCGYISPIPYMNGNDEIAEENIADFMEAISNEVVSYQSIKEKFQKDNGVTYAEKEIVDKKIAEEITGEGNKKFVAGSTLCVNLRHIDKIPAFYNPPLARGEDTFFSMNLDEAKVFRVPVYHFHDGFLKYTAIMEKEYPTTLKMVRASDKTIEKRFLKACEGWIKYKPLYMYILDKDNYETKLKAVKKKLKRSIKKVDYLFENSDFEELVNELEEYDKKVEEHYQEYVQVNEIWNRLRKLI